MGDSRGKKFDKKKKKKVDKEEDREVIRRTRRGMPMRIFCFKSCLEDS